ncbi:hypothetical protein BJV82DRAFT_606010 [Fennellomyces sp. T-0311]|nr:hypothetical protein BJV82DRAFT_606010 [Fennellomyces sp. T-0311]
MRLRNTPEPCKTCKLRRRRCDRDHDQMKCERCTRLQLECTPCNDNFNNFENDLIIVQDGYQEVQNWQTDADRLDSEMEQLTVMKAEVQVASTQRSPVEWQLSITNGVIRLNTPIRTMEELHMFSQASIRYLSPFIGVFERAPLRFESSSVSISFGLTSIIQQQELLKPRNKRFSTAAYEDININSLTADEYRDIIRHLIPLYLHYYVCIVGLLHVPSFFEYYNSLDDPLNNAVVLAMCIDALIYLRHGLTYSPAKRRVLADAFYDKCTELLFDMYDDPKQKLQVVFTTSFLQTYLRDVTLNNQKADNLTAVALLICAELQNDRNITLTRVQSIILHRHYLYLEASSRFFYMLREGKIDFTLPRTVKKVEWLDDEPEKTKAYMMLCNHLFLLLGSSFITKMIEKVSSTFLGKSCEVTLEDILMFKPLVHEAWSSLSNESRLCDDPFHPEAYKHVTQVVPGYQLYPFVALHMLTIVICASTLRPNDISCADSGIINDVIQSVRENQISLALNSCKVLIHALEANWNTDTCDTPTVSTGVMRYVIYCLERVSRCSDIPFPYDLLNLFKRVIDVKLSSSIPAGHEVPPSSSIVVTSLEGSKVSPYDVYEQYPFAGQALMLDVIRTSVSQLDEYLMSLN